MGELLCCVAFRFCLSFALEWVALGWDFWRTSRKDRRRRSDLE